MEGIKRQIENTVYWFKINSKKVTILAKGKSKNETKKILKKLAEDKSEYAIILRVIIKVHKKLRYDTCILSFNFDNFQIKNGKLKRIHLDGKSGFIWFEKDWLLENGWNKKYISNVVHLLRKEKAEIIIPGINLYQLFGKN